MHCGLELADRQLRQTFAVSWLARGWLQLATRAAWPPGRACCTHLHLGRLQPKLAIQGALDHLRRRRCCGRGRLLVQGLQRGLQRLRDVHQQLPLLPRAARRLALLPAARAVGGRRVQGGVVRCPLHGPGRQTAACASHGGRLQTRRAHLGGAVASDASVALALMPRWAPPLGSCHNAALRSSLAPRERCIGQTNCRSGLACLRDPTERVYVALRPLPVT